jgi:hypothetical protein
MDDEQIGEASWVAQAVTGTSSYLHGIGYDLDQLNREIEEIVEHVKKSAQG